MEKILLKQFNIRLYRVNQFMVGSFFYAIFISSSLTLTYRYKDYSSFPNYAIYMVAKRQIIKGDKNDKDFQRQIIDNLVYKVYVSDDNTTVYLNIKGGQNIETLEFSEHSEKMETIKNGTNGVRTLSPLSLQICYILS